MSHWDYGLKWSQRVFCIETIWDGNNNNNTMLSFWSPDKRLPPPKKKKNTTVAHKSDLAFRLDKSRKHNIAVSVIQPADPLGFDLVRHLSSTCANQPISSLAHCIEAQRGTHVSQDPLQNTCCVFFCLLSCGKPLPSRWVKGGVREQDRGFNKSWCCLVWF